MLFFENGQKIQKFTVQSDFSSRIRVLSRCDYYRMETSLKCRPFAKKKKLVNFLKNNQSIISRKSERDLIRVFENVSDYNLGL